MLAPVHCIPQSLSVRRADDTSLGDVHRRVEIDGVVAWAKFATLRLSYQLSWRRNYFIKGVSNYSIVDSVNS